MATDAFQFLRATYWRWAETIYRYLPGAEGRARRCWRSATSTSRTSAPGATREGRLVWGVNDFDEAARMPYAIDIVRLATSAVLAEVPGHHAAGDLRQRSEGISRGHRQPKPFVLDRENERLAHALRRDRGRAADFWTKFDPAQIEADDRAGEERQRQAAEGAARDVACGRATARCWSARGPTAACAARLTTRAPPGQAASAVRAISASVHGRAT